MKYHLPMEGPRAAASSKQSPLSYPLPSATTRSALLALAGLGWLAGAFGLIVFLHWSFLRPVAVFPAVLMWWQSIGSSLEHRQASKHSAAQQSVS